MQLLQFLIYMFSCFSIYIKVRQLVNSSTHQLINSSTLRLFYQYLFPFIYVDTRCERISFDSVAKQIYDWGICIRFVSKYFIHGIRRNTFRGQNEIQKHLPIRAKQICRFFIMSNCTVISVIIFHEIITCIYWAECSAGIAWNPGYLHPECIVMSDFENNFF